jgi:hypothetical protein
VFDALLALRGVATMLGNLIRRVGAAIGKAVGSVIRRVARMVGPVVGH